MKDSWGIYEFLEEFHFFMKFFKENSNLFEKIEECERFLKNLRFS